MSKIISFFKEYKKGAIIGGIIGAVGIFYAMVTLTAAHGYSHSTIDLIAFPWKLFQKFICVNPLNCSDIIGAAIMGIGVMVLFYAIIGSIVGAIIQKIWRKHR